MRSQVPYFRVPRATIVLSLCALLISAWLVAAHVQALTINRCVIRPHAVCVKRNLHGKNLLGAHLANANLTGTNLSGANLTTADLRHANLTGANLSHANLTRANVAGANMIRANLHGAILTGVSLATVTLTGVRSGGITRGPARMPPGYVIRRGYLLRVLATPVFSLSSGPQRVVLHRFGPSPGAVGYAAQLCDAPGLNCLPAVRVTTAGHTFFGLSGKAVYTVKLTAIGNGTTTANSRTASRRAVAGAASPGAIPPATPSFTLTPGPGSLTIDAFAAVPHASGYSAQRCDAAGNHCAAAVPISTSGHTFTGLTGGATYTIKLTAIGDGTVYASSIPAAVTSVPKIGAKSRVAHVVWVLMENEDYARVIGSASAPYINSLARTHGLATNYAAVSHPSLPNYISLTSGSTQGITNDSNPPSHRLAVNSIFSQMNGHWKALEESMPSNCSSRDSGLYAVRHNPAMYFTSLAAQCATNDIPLGATPDISSAFTFVTPNLCSDMHDCGIAAGNKWLSMFIPKLLASPQYMAGSTVIFIVWDENSSGAAGNRVPAVVVSPWTNSTTRSAAFTHYSVLRTTEELLGVPLIGGAQQAPSMRSTFNLP